MKPSFYNIFIDQTDTSKTVIFNTLYGSLLVLEPEEKNRVLQILKNPSVAYLSGDSEIYTILLDNKFIIEEEQNELEIVTTRKRMGIEDKNRLDLIFLPTLNCNFACTYCYEKPVISSMPDGVKQSVLEWMKRIIPEYKFVLLHWFGGEPLLEINRISTITREIRSIVQSHQIGYSFHITTNGYLLNNVNIKKLLNCEIKDFQITVDGTEKYHNQFRVLRNGKPTFDKIYRNIIRLAEVDENVKISLRINFNHTNFNSIPEMLALFPEKIRPQLRIVFEPIFGNCTISAVDNIQHSLLSEKLIHFHQLAKDLNYDVVLGLDNFFSGKLVNCYAERINQYIINYNGDVHKCSVSNFEKGNRVGYINNTGEFIKEPDAYSLWINNDFFEDKCYNCQYLPLCMGGCKKMRLEQNSTGSMCNLIPTNTSYLLKQIAINGLNSLINSEVR